MRKMPAQIMEREKAFFSWLSTRVTNHQLSELYTYLPEINLYGMKRSLLTDSLFELEDCEQVRQLMKTAQEDNRFKFTHIAMIRPMMLLLRKYCDYVEEEKQVEATRNSSPVLKQDSEIDRLLIGDDYALLRDELAKHDITTIEQLKHLNVWAFMNRYGVYGLRKRREINNQIDALLKPSQPNEYEKSKEKTEPEPDSVVVVIDPEPIATKEEAQKDTNHGITAAWPIFSLGMKRSGEPGNTGNMLICAKRFSAANMTGTGISLRTVRN